MASLQPAMQMHCWLLLLLLLERQTVAEQTLLHSRPALTSFRCRSKRHCWCWRFQ